jgi:GNAT superfamily N-acetyltransferase
MAERLATPSDGESISASTRVRGYRLGDEHALVEMSRSIFPEHYEQRSLDDWRWCFRQAPEGPADIRVLESEDRVVGSIAHVPVAVWIQGRRRRLAIGCDLMIRPEFRGQGWSQQLVSAFLAAEHAFDVNFGVVNAGSSSVMGRNAGTVTMGRVKSWIRVRSRGGAGASPKRSVQTAAARLYGGSLSWPRPRVRVEDLALPCPDVDDLARESADFAPCIRVRDSAYLRWHWLEQPGGRWRVRGVRDADGGLCGLAVSGCPPDSSSGHREGVIADLLARDEETTRALLLDAWSALVGAGCHTVRCVYRDPRPWARRTMFRSGFIPRDGPLVACGPLSSAAGSEIVRFESWYVTYGDTDI